MTASGLFAMRMGGIGSDDEQAQRTILWLNNNFVYLSNEFPAHHGDSRKSTTSGP